MSIAEKLTTIAENEQRVYDAGKNAERNKFWGVYLANAEGGSRTTYTNAFYGYGWTDETYNPPEGVIITAHASSNNMFNTSYITDTKVPISIASASYGNKGNTFSGASNLVTVRKFIINEIQRMSGQFTGCTSLQNLTIEGTIGTTASFQDCPLTRASIENVVSCLSDTTSGLTCAFNEDAVNAVFTEDEWDALKQTKPNWSFGF
jgi:hypothetical protein